MINLIHRLFSKPDKAICVGPKDFPGGKGWPGRGVLADFDKAHGLEILVSDIGNQRYTEENFKKEWDTDADEIIFRRGKMIMLYWRKNSAA